MWNTNALIPPALWATGGLEACLPKESFFPESLFPQGRGLPLPYPTLEAPPFAVGLVTDEKIRQDKTSEGKTSKNKTREVKTRQDKSRQGKARHAKPS